MALGDEQRVEEIDAMLKFSAKVPVSGRHFDHWYHWQQGLSNGGKCCDYYSVTFKKVGDQ